MLSCVWWLLNGSVSHTSLCLCPGLRIAPPEAPVTGYMFGKGVYFANMVSKSANYCWTSPTNNTGGGGGGVVGSLCLFVDGVRHLSHARDLTRVPLRCFVLLCWWMGCGACRPPLVV